ncbi:MAG: cytochrome-c peroxidase [Bacteroidia bacterium]
MGMKAGYFFTALILIAGLISCGKDEAVIPPPVSGGGAPSHFPAPVYPISSSQVENAKFELGRKMFYDENLSLDRTISCSSCHKTMAAFSDPGRSTSLGVGGKTGVRNAPALFNLAWKPSMMWDGGVVNLEFQPVAPLTDTNEMHMQIKDVVLRLQEKPEYSDLFQKAFGNSEINSQRMLLAFARFLSALISAGSVRHYLHSGESECIKFK